MNTIHDRGCYCFMLETMDTVDIFTRVMYKQIIVHSLNHFINSKGLIVYGWCLMSNKLYVICQTLPNESLDTIIYSFESFTSQKILEALQGEQTDRNIWLLKHFEYNNSVFDISSINGCWKHLHIIAEIDTNQPQSLAEQLEFIHAIPVKERVVQFPSDYIYSSARDYTNITGLVNITKPSPNVEGILSEIESRKNNFMANSNRHFQ